MPKTIENLVDTLRSQGFRVLRSPAGDAIPPVRWAKGFWRLVNDATGRPLASREEILERRERERVRVAKLGEIAANKAAEAKRQAEEEAAGKQARGDAAPVILYLDERSGRDVQRIKQVLAGRDIPFRELDVEHDEASKSWVLTSSKARELPVVFVAGVPIGGYDELVQADASGALLKMVYGGV